VTGTRDESDDAALLRAHVAGDRDAFAELVRRHRDRLWALALRTLGDREEAADAVQDALVSAYRSADRFRGDAAVTTWLHRIVVNACLDRVRRLQARPTVPLPEHEVGLVAVRGGATPYDSDTVLTVRAALAQLPAEQRVALVLLDMQGYSVAEIARMLDVAEGTIKSRCARGRARLAVLLGHLRRDDGDFRHPVADQGNRPAADDVRESGASGTDHVGATDTDHVGQGGVW
jgi:RNA polymerase sigma-70 factor, ECF subfamily